MFLSYNNSLQIIVDVIPSRLWRDFGSCFLQVTVSGSPQR